MTPWPATIPFFSDNGIGHFFENYWQKKPCFIPKAFEPSSLPKLSPEELAGMSLEEDVESRFVTKEENGGYQLVQGPFTEEFFAATPETPWTLLVQGVEQWLPQFDDLKRLFRFAPDWRLDDIMVSYAAPGGGVGPHTDHYDVFLIQGEGHRIWHVGDKPINEPTWRKNSDLKILEDFTPDATFELQPGDMLYVPPEFAHDGIAGQGGSMTFSVGFRSPEAAELLKAFARYLQRHDIETFYEDEGPVRLSNPAQLAATQVASIQQFLVASILDETFFPQFLGDFLTTRKPHAPSFEADPLSNAQQLAELIKGGGCLYRVGGARFLWRDQDATLMLHVNGQHWSFDRSHKDALLLLCEKIVLTAADLNLIAAALPIAATLLQLVEQGVFHCERLGSDALSDH